MKFIEKRKYTFYPDEVEIWDATGDICSIEGKGAPDILEHIEKFGPVPYHCIIDFHKREIWELKNCAYVKDNKLVQFYVFEPYITELKDSYFV